MADSDDVPAQLHATAGDALDQLSREDLAWLSAAARRLCVGDTLEPEELLYETLARLLVDQRAWRADLPLRAQVYSAMKSVLFSWRKTRTRHPQVAWDEARDLLALDDGDGELAVDEDYETRLRQQLDQLAAEFADDVPARDLLSAALLGFHGAELEIVTGLSTAQILATRKRLGRRVAALPRKES